MQISFKHYVMAAAIGLSSAVLLAAGGALPSWADKKIPFTPPQSNGGQTSYWSGVGGEDPGTPGCHMEFVPDQGGMNKCAEWINGRQFGEACVDGKTLIETNPADGICHPHDNDVGGPYQVNCETWCAQKNANNTGKCVAAEAQCGGDRGSVPSAKCECSPKPMTSVKPTSTTTTITTTTSVAPTPTTTTVMPMTSTPPTTTTPPPTTTTPVLTPMPSR